MNLSFFEASIHRSRRTLLLVVVGLASCSLAQAEKHHLTTGIGGGFAAGLLLQFFFMRRRYGTPARDENRLESAYTPQSARRGPTVEHLAERRSSSDGSSRN